MAILFALIIALLAAGIFAVSNGRTTGASLVTFFLILFLAAMASQFWIVPFGPLLWGVAWLPMVFIILLFGFLLLIPSPGNSRTGAESREAAAAASSFSAISVFAWIIFLLLLISILIGYFYK